MPLLQITHPKLLLWLLFTLVISCPLYGQWQPLPGPNGGKITCWTQSDDNVLYAGGAAGIFKSTDGGKTWTGLSGNPQLNQLPRKLKWDEGNLYLSTQFSSGSGQFLWKSTDDGATWINLRNDLFTQNNYRAVFDARHDTIVVKASPSSVISTDGGNTWVNILPIISYNVLGTDKGWLQTNGQFVERWETFNTWLTSYEAATPALHPRRLLEAGGRVFMFFANGPDFKMSADGGDSWQDGSLPIPYNDNEVSVAERNDTLFVQGQNAIAYSVDDAQTWSVLSTPQLPQLVRNCFFPATGGVVALSDFGIYQEEQASAPFLPTAGFSSQNVNTSLLDPNGNWWLGTDFGLFFSPDNGNSWQETLAGFDRQPITWIRQAGQRILAGNNTETEFFYTPDMGVNWQKRMLPDIVSDIEVTDNEVFIGVCIGAYRSTDWGNSWQIFNPVPNAFTSCVEVFQKRDSVLAVSARWLKLYLSLDKGDTWQNFSAGLGGISYITHDIGISATHLYVVNGFRILRSPFSGPQWTELDLPLPVIANDGPIPRYFHFVGDTIFAAIPKAGIYRSTDGGQNWANWAPTNLAVFSNSFQFNDALTVMCSNGGVWYIGSLPNTDVFGGRIYVDANQNQVFDSGETPLPGHLVRLKNQQIFASTTTDGKYSFDWRNQPDSVQIQLFTSGAMASPKGHFVGAPVDTLDFAVAPTNTITDLAIDLTNSQVPRPGFEFDLYLTCRNDGYQASGGTVQLVKDPSLSWVNFSETPNQIDSDTATWITPVIPPGNAVQYRIRLHVNSAVQLGTLLYLWGKLVSSNVLDSDGANNVTLTVLSVLGSRDPNDKSVSPAGPISPTMVADSQMLTYTIRFQNTGTYPAEFVRIVDTISAGLDLSSLRVLAASHNFEWTLRGRVIEFYFPNIQLPDSLSDEPGSHGFVKFGLRVRSDLELGDVVENAVDIFFDFNLPIRTNTVKTLVGETSSISTQLPTHRYYIAPNPVRDLLGIFGEDNSVKHLPSKLDFYDQNGRYIQSLNQINLPAKVSVNNFPPGNYWLKITQGAHEGWVQWVKL